MPADGVARPPAIGFSIYLNTIIQDNKALGVIGLYNCVGGFLALPVGRLSDTVGRRPIALFAMAIDLAACARHLARRRPAPPLPHPPGRGADYAATIAAQLEHQPKWHGSLLDSVAPATCGYACAAGLLDGGARSLMQVGAPRLVADARAAEAAVRGGPLTLRAAVAGPAGGDHLHPLLQEGDRRPDASARTFSMRLPALEASRGPPGLFSATRVARGARPPAAAGLGGGVRGAADLAVGLLHPHLLRPHPAPAHHQRALRHRGPPWPRPSLDCSMLSHSFRLRNTPGVCTEAVAPLTGARLPLAPTPRSTTSSP